MKTVGLIGLGLVGAAVARRWIAHGWTVVGYDVNDERRSEFHALGGESVGGPADVARRCRTVVLSLPDSQIVARVVTEFESELRAGDLVVDMTTGRPEDTLALADRLEQRGAVLVDATIVGSSQQIADGAAVVLAGGPSDAVTTCEPLLRGFAERVFPVGPVGSGARMKLVVNLVLGLNRAVLAEGLALARAAGFDPALALDVLRQSPAASAVMTTKGPKMVSGDFTPQARLAQHAKDVDLILELGRQHDASLPLSSVHRELLGQAIAAGWGTLDNSAIAKVFERRDA